MKNPDINISSNLTKKTKQLLDKHCEMQGIRLHHFLEEAILEKLENEMDRQIISEREFEKLIPWKNTV